MVSSVWGKGDSLTIRELKKLPIGGFWLNLAAGDGRYNSLLLSKARQVIAADIDQNGLDVLRKNATGKQRKKLKIKLVDISKRLPFSDNRFDGVLCTGTLHLFRPKTLHKIFLEIDRILKPNGFFVFDFAADISRKKASGYLVRMKKKEPHYELKKARKLLEQNLGGFQASFLVSKVPKEKIWLNKKTEYFFECRFLLVIARKKS